MPSDLSAEQNAMLERLLEKHDLKSYPTTIGAEEALRELLLAVQERSAELAECGDPRHKGYLPQDCEVCQVAELIRAQTYADLFLKEE